MAFRILLKNPLGDRARRILRGTAWVVGGGFLAGLVFVGSFYLAIKAERRSTEVRVPDFSGMPLEQADATAGPLGLRLQVVDRRHDPAVSSGKVLQQEPVAGAAVRRGRKIKLVLSLGGRVLVVPEIVGQAARAVEIELEREGFASGFEAKVHLAKTPPGRIASQVPAAGSPAVPSTRVHRLVSEGSRDPIWVMPDLTGLSRTAAERWIRECGLRVGSVRRVPSVDAPRETVVGQLPLAGYPVRSREVVELTLAR